MHNCSIESKVVCENEIHPSRCFGRTQVAARRRGLPPPLLSLRSTRGEKEGAESLAGIEASRARAADERSARRRNKKRHGDVRDSQRTLLKLRVFLLQKVFFRSSKSEGSAGFCTSVYLAVFCLRCDTFLEGF